MKTYGVLVIGCGHIGMQHLEDIYFRDNIRVEGVVDRDAARAQAAARRFGARSWGTDYRPMLEQEQVQIVIIATNVDSHLPILRDCLAHHKHVLCEKPIARTLEEGREFMELARHAEEKVLVAHILRHNRSYQKIKELIDSGAIGKVTLLRMTQNHHAMEWPRYCRLLRDCSPTVDCGVHYYDVAQWLTGSRITQVSGFGTLTQPDAPRDNYTMVNFRLENGCAGFYEAGWGQSLRSANVKEFIGTKGRITLEMQAQRDRDGEEGDLITLLDSTTDTYTVLNMNSTYKDMYGQLASLIEMIETNHNGVFSLEEAWSAFRVAVSAEEAIRTGRTVYIPAEL